MMLGSEAFLSGLADLGWLRIRKANVRRLVHVSSEFSCTINRITWISAHAAWVRLLLEIWYGRCVVSR